MMKEKLMADIINFQNYIIDSKQKRSFTPWKKRFGEDLDFFSRLSDLSDKILYILARPEYESMEALRELVMAILGKGPVSKFLFLSDQEQGGIDALSLFMQEQIAFEMMARLQWIDEYPCRRYSLVSLVENFGKQHEVCVRAMPLLSPSDPEFSEYIKLGPELQKEHLKSRFLKAYEAFEKKIIKSRGSE